ncbi:MAG: ribokinase [Micavibrio aeruginosavorus]|uniref:Ribokinase n=1 Tax=Micavibrio aeruginosavorus TaxID=349221 RepID=A0A2W5N5H8_9BACT|nr:MAG: ribokinase [Micavibrio aeruginosavorus]
MLAAIISKLGLPLLISVIGEALGKVDNNAAQEASKVLNGLQGALSAEQMAEANRHAEKMAELKSSEESSALAQINESLRLESQSTDPYVRRMRPTFGYLMAITWAAQMLGLAYVMIFKTEKAPAVFDSMEALSTIWAVGLSVLGIYVYKRSEEKKVSASVKEKAPSPKISHPKVNE